MTHIPIWHWLICATKGFHFLEISIFTGEKNSPFLWLYRKLKSLILRRISLFFFFSARKIVLQCAGWKAKTNFTFITEIFHHKQFSSQRSVGGDQHILSCRRREWEIIYHQGWKKFWWPFLLRLWRTRFRPNSPAFRFKPVYRVTRNPKNLFI